MSAITPLFEQVQLAEAAYANFFDDAGNLITTRAQLETALTTGDGDFSDYQAAAFADQWQVIGHAPDTAAGFSATIFKNRQTGVYSLAIRGSTDFTDYSADAALIAVDGVAVRQLVDLYNFWNRSAGASSQAYSIAQVVLYDSLGNLPSGAIPIGDSPYGIVLGNSSDLPDASLRLATGSVPTGMGAINVIGHSLGGHLAMAFTRIFPNITSNCSAVNGLGFKIGNSTVDSLFSILGGAPGFNASSILNVYGIAGPEFAAMNNGVLQQPGGYEGLFIENGSINLITGFPSHSSVQMTDSAAVYDLFIRLSSQIRGSTPAAALATLKPLFEASSAQAESSLERVVDALVMLFQLDFPPLVESPNNNREELYKRIVPLQAITKNLSDSNPGMYVDVLATASTTAESMALLASGSEALAYRYALKALNPFAIVGENFLYALHNQNGELDLYNPVAKTGSLTSAWIADRAEFLARKNIAHIADKAALISPEFGVENRTQYKDVASGYALTLSEVDLPAHSISARQIIFGSDASDFMEGGSKSDRIYGNAGADYLRGKLNNDHLEGGRGMDVYEYNGGKSFTGNLANDGNDTILDADGKGVLRYVFNEGGLAGIGAKSTSAIIRDASSRVSGTEWSSADGKFTYERNGSDLVVRIIGDAGGQLTLKDYKEGDFGIYLFDVQREAPQTTRNITGDKTLLELNGEQAQRKAPGGEPLSYLSIGDDRYERLSDPTPADWLNVRFVPGSYTLAQVSGVISYYTLPLTVGLLYNEADELGNLKRMNEDAPDLEDQLYDSAGNDNIFAGGGNDRIDAHRGGADVIKAGAGRDIVNAGAGGDVVEAGADGATIFGAASPVAGGDMINGGAGDDELYGNIKITLSLAIKNGETDIATNAIGDFISGEAGNDWIVGDKGRDALLGGDGDDILVGGAGNDNLFGDINHTAPDAAWSITSDTTGNAISGFTYRTLFSGVNMVADGSGGKDVLYGGAGDDRAYGGMGDDFIDGGSGQNVMIGEGGADVIIGGSDNDVLIGDNGTVTPIGQAGGDFLDGGAGNDHVQGDDGDDVLIGGGGNDVLLGGDGNDILIGGAGLDQLIGGAGKDIYVFNRGDGTEVVVDTARDAKDPEASVLVLGDGIFQNDIKFRPGSLMVDLGPSDPDDPLAGNDEIHFINFNHDFPELTAAIGEIRFADGSVMNYADILAQGFDIDGTALDDLGGDALIGSSLTDRIRGFAGSDELEGRDGDDVLTGDGGADRLDAGNGNDVLDGGTGNEFLAGGMGSDDYRFVRGDGLDTVVEGSLFAPGLSDPGQTDRIVFGAGVAREDVTLLRGGDGNLSIRYGAGDEIVVVGQYNLAGADIERIVFADGLAIEKAELDALEVGVVIGTADADELYGTSGNDVLRGDAGDDYLDGGPVPERRLAGSPLLTGDDQLDGGTGADTYALYWGMGQDRIIEVEDGQVSTLALLAGATLESIRTRRVGDDLRVELRGGGGGATVQGFFSSADAAAWLISSAAEGSESLLGLYEAQATAENGYAVDAMEDYKQGLLGEWRARGQAAFQLPTHVYVKSSWSQTITEWTRLVPALPDQILQTQTFVNDPVSYSTVGGFGVQQGGRILGVSQGSGSVIQRLVDPLIITTQSDDAVIEAAALPETQSTELDYSFFAGGGGPFGNSRTYSYNNGFVVNTVTESSIEGWVPLTLREDGLGDFNLSYQQVTENPVIEQIEAGAGNNVITGAVENDPFHVALIDGGAGDDDITAGQSDFVMGGEGDDVIAGGAYAYGGAGFDRIEGSAFMSGGADDDLLYGGEDETTFYFRSEDAGSDQVSDRNGLALNDFAVRAGFVESTSNLVYGGKYRLGGETSFAIYLALERRLGEFGAVQNFLAERWTYAYLNPEEEAGIRYPVLNENAAGFPRGVPDQFNRANAPYYSDGYYSWVYNSVEDMMRDFAELGIPFSASDVSQIPEVDLSDFTGETYNHAALRPFFYNGVLDRDTVQLEGAGGSVDDLVIGYGETDADSGRKTLRILWGDDKVINIELPKAGDLIGYGVEEIQAGSETLYIRDAIAIADETGVIGTPFEDYLVGTAGDDRISGFGQWDFVDGGAGNDLLSGGTGIDEFFFEAGDGVDRIVDPDADDIIVFGNGVSPTQLKLGLGSLQISYGDNGEAIHFEGFNPADVYESSLFDALSFYTIEYGDVLPDGSIDEIWTLTGELTFAEVIGLGFDIEGGSSDDLISGTNVVDRISGGAGNDQLIGGEGGDSYFFSAGDGVDVVDDRIEAGVVNRVVFRDYNEADITGFKDGQFVVLRADTGDEVRIAWDMEVGRGVDRVEFADGAVWNRNDLDQLDLANSQPVVSAPIGSVPATEDVALAYTVPSTTFTDPDAGDTLTFAAKLSNGDPLPGWLIFDAATRTFSGTPGNDDVGSLLLKVTATDSDGASVADTFSLDVLNTNDAPVLAGALANQSATEDQAFVYAVPAGVFQDVDAGDVLNFSVALSNGAALPQWLVFDEATNTFSGVPGNEDVGSLVVRVTATDAAGESVSTTFSLAVANTNDAPLLVNPLLDQSVAAGTPFSYVVPVESFADADAGDAVTLSAHLVDGTALPSWLAFDAQTGTFTGTFSGTPSASNVGLLDVRVVASDNAGSTATDDFVLAVNPAPGQLLTGTAAADVLAGGYGNDRIDGLGSADRMLGGDGDDSYVVDQVGDVVVELAGEGHDVVESGATFTLPDQVEDLLLTGAANTNGSGNALANRITGNSGANRLDGGAGDDLLIGGLGNDTYVVGSVGDAVFEAAAAGTDTVQASVTYALAANVENLLLSGSAAIDGAGNDLANTLTGNAADNVLAGGAGNDRLVGGEGSDTLIGGAGNDTYVIDNINDSVIELAGEGSDTVQAPFDYTLAGQLENLTLAGVAVSGTGNAAANRLTGNALDNVLFGLEGNDVLSGAAGADTMVGGSGNDTYVVDNVSDMAVELAGEGTDSVQASVSYVLGAEIENLTLTGTANLEGTGNEQANRLTGNAGNNVLSGMAGNDILDGKAGADVMLGGAGNDTYYVDHVGDSITELENEGADAVLSSVTYALADHVENLTLSGTAAIDGTGNNGINLLIGNAADNRLSGFGGNDVLDGKVGADTLTGGTGNDTYVIDNSGDLVVEAADEGIDTVQSAIAWALCDNLENLTLTGVAAVNGVGNSLDNLLTGNNANNTLSGFGGNDVLDGKGGNDTMIGGSGNDIYVVAQTGDLVVEMANEGVDTVHSAITYTLGEHVEHLLLTGSAAIRGTGNSLANTLTGNSGNNQLDGLLGADKMIGGAGGDTYLVDDAGDQVVELAGEGVDVVKSTVSYTLSAEVENLTLTGTAAINGTGNSLDNIILGNAAVNALSGGAGNDALNGGVGADTMAGGAGDDFYIVDNTGDAVIEVAGEGIDTISTALTWTLGEHVENLTLTGSSSRNGTGNSLSNTISGNRGVNILNGLAGNDILAGGLGNDIYRFDFGFGRDVIAEDDATAGNLDRIQFGAGIAASDIALGRLNDDLVIRTVDQQNSIQVMDWFSADSHKVERIEFANGVFWDAASIQSMAMQTIDMPGLLRGDSQASVLLGQIGNTLLEGGAGNDILTDDDGNNLFSGGAGDDVATGGDGNDLFVGGSGSDTLYTGGGSNIIAFNSGGGTDTVYSESGAENTLSLGGGLRYSDLSLSRDSNDLILNAGTDDRIVLKDWYAGKDNLLNLQLILDATDEFDSTATDPLYSHRVQSFDFLGMVAAFDAAQANNPGLSQWALSDALMQYHLSGVDGAALGGDLAYWYARNGTLNGIGVAAAQQIIGAPGFGADAQGLREFSGLQEGLVRLG